MNVAEINTLSGIIVDAAMCVHSELGPGLLESVYERCLEFELQSRRLVVDRQVLLPIVYKTIRLDEAYRIDLLVEDSIVVELKTVSTLLPLHDCQRLTYLKLSGHRLGLMFNFHEAHLRHGIRRMANNL